MYTWVSSDSAHGTAFFLLSVLQLSQRESWHGWNITYTSISTTEALLCLGDAKYSKLKLTYPKLALFLEKIRNYWWIPHTIATIGSLLQTAHLCLEKFHIKIPEKISGRMLVKEHEYLIKMNQAITGAFAGWVILCIVLAQGASAYFRKEQVLLDNDTDENRITLVDSQCPSNENIKRVFLISRLVSDVALTVLSPSCFSMWNLGCDTASFVFSLKEKWVQFRVTQKDRLISNIFSNNTSCDISVYLHIRSHVLDVFKEANPCAICFEKLISPQNVIFPCSNHYYHTQCLISRWVQQNSIQLLQSIKNVRPLKMESGKDIYTMALQVSYFLGWSDRYTCEIELEKLLSCPRCNNVPFFEPTGEIIEHNSWPWKRRSYVKVNVTASPSPPSTFQKISSIISKIIAVVFLIFLAYVIITPFSLHKKLAR